MKKGLFITVEGADGAGKSTQIDFIMKYLQDRGIKSVFTREPGGTKIGEKIRDILLDRENSEMNYMAEALLYAASRAQHVAEVIRPALLEGKAVVCDRFVDSSMAYQGVARGLGESVAVINSYAINDCMPDVTFLLKVDPSVSKRRIREDECDRIEQEADEFHRRVYEGYIELEKKFPDRIIGIDASKGVREIGLEIGKHLERIINAK
ncbi:MAG: dTMP kinase [Clostridia bacterium]|nr:dTMP kinase [Clostridia bacterium]